MDCASCASKIGSALEAVEGVEAFATNPTTGLVTVTRTGSGAAREAAVAAIRDAGYAVADVSSVAGPDGSPAMPEGEDVWTSSRAIRTWVSGALVAVGGAWALVAGPDGTASPVPTLASPDLWFLAAVAVAGTDILGNGYRSLRHRSPDIDLLMSVAILGAVASSLAFGGSYYFEAAMLAFLFSVAELLEGYAMEQARGSLRDLMELAPDEATVVRDGQEVTVAADEVAPGDRVRVRPGEKIPVDGEVADGDSAVDEAPITGESIPVDKAPGDAVYAGTVNEGGFLEVEATSEASDNTLARIVRMVEDAHASRTEREQFVDRFAAVYTLLVVAVAVLLAAGPPLLLGLPWPTYILYGLTMLVLACPCAFVISTPVSVVSGITSAARNGVLVKGGNHLEAVGEVGAVALDKTGTLTKGTVTVTDVVPLHGHTPEDVLGCARGLEARSEHPIGEAIVTQADAAEAGAPEVEGFESITGKGVQASLDGTVHYAGKPGLFDELGFDLSHVHAAMDHGEVPSRTQDLCQRNDCMDLLDDLIPELQSQGKTVVVVGREDEVEGVIALADEIRPGAREAVQRLRDLGVQEVVMLTGDNERTARAVAERVGVDDVRAELLPDEKVEAVRELDERYDGVAMVGDGVNDAPALATATVGVAMGAAGTDTALETADIALMGDDLAKLPYVYDLSRGSNRVIRQNIGSSLAAKALLAGGVPLGLVPIWLAVLVGDAGMTLAVTGNASRLSRVQPVLPRST
jgi:Cd2+/Zn2+-exporting ATPase